MNDAQIWELIPASRWTRLPAASVIVREDEPGHSLFLLAQGEVKVTKKGRLLDVLRAGDCFDEMSYIHGAAVPRQATVQSMSDVLVVEFDNDALANMSESCQLRIAHSLLRTVSERLALANGRISRGG